MDTFIPLLIPLIAVLVALAMVALFAGVESRDGFDPTRD